MSRLFYNRNHTFSKLFWYFRNYFENATLPTAENLFLLTISMLALESFRSVRFAWSYIISKLLNFENLEMICAVRSNTILYDLPEEGTGKRGRPHIHGERLSLSDIPLKKPENADYFMGCHKVITNLWKDRRGYAYVSATAPDKSDTFRLFLCTAIPEEICVKPEEQASEKIRNYNTWGMLPLGLFTLRWNIETSYYETNIFWSFCDYMVCSVKGIERLSNLTCIAYATVKLLPYYGEKFKDYQRQSP